MRTNLSNNSEGSVQTDGRRSRSCYGGLLRAAFEASILNRSFPASNPSKPGFQCGGTAFFEHTGPRVRR